jgi:hypothetical protein
MERARRTLGYARNAYADGGRLTELAGALAVSAAMAAHAVLAARGEWVTNEKRILDRAGLRGMDHLINGLQRGPAVPGRIIDQAVELFDDALATTA